MHADMLRAGLEPDGHALQTVIGACEKAGAWEEADAVRSSWDYHCYDAETRKLLRVGAGPGLPNSNYLYSQHICASTLLSKLLSH